MDVKKILIADTAVEFCEALAQTLESKFDLRICHDGLEAEALIRAYEPDVLVMDLTLPNLDGITLLGRISILRKRPKILLTTRFISPYIEHVISGFGVDLVMVKPCNIGAMTDRVLDLTTSRGNLTPVPMRQRNSVSSMLMDLDIPVKRRGFIYLEMCIELCAEKPGQPLTKLIYPAVAKHYGTKAEAVERAIRQAIHETWARRDEKIWRMYFHSGRNGEVPRPTNAEFISRLAERQRQIFQERA
jgi:two-component system response regulator (stage 0 sporulation protein A)